MFLATADESISIRIRKPDDTYAQAPHPRVVDRYRELVKHLSDYRPEAFLYIPSPIRPRWFATTQKRIYASVRPNERARMNDGCWLSRDVADAANAFFQKTADLLPEEPFIYSSQRGDLVAEFKAERGTMTSIVSPTFVVLFAVVDGMPLERRVLEGGDVREQVLQLTGMLRTGLHGAVDTTK
jgi:hypothetical protein